jgi:hypothetical protein
MADSVIVMSPRYPRPAALFRLCGRERKWTAESKPRAFGMKCDGPPGGDRAGHCDGPPGQAMATGRGAGDSGRPALWCRTGLRFAELLPRSCFTGCYEAGLRWSRTYSSVPEPGPLLVPDGWHESYGLDWVGQPV